ncbi:MlaD family protein [Rhodocyclus tenuis]|uniref:MlaD family protein n=1 Tax=Rhodocyclus tenuis TaxID=1066 RepID=UPI0019065F62|nr:MlaD family protein [Rhodocyclus tenuis]MBK1679091.1 mammalian cell entry protein [Rhodocyclus tenuis]
MENRSHALIAGLFTLLLLLASLSAVWWFGGKREPTHDFVVVTRQNVTGLGPQGQVRYRGIAVGKVQSIELDPQDGRNILVRIGVNEQVPVTRGTTAKLGFQGVTGIAHVLLEETGRDPTPLVSSDGTPPRITMQASLIEELSEVGTQTMREARDFLAATNQLLNAENRKRIAHTLDNLESGSTHAAEIAAQIHVLLSPENVRALGSTLARLESASGELAPTLRDARATLASLRATSERLDLTLGNPASGGVNELLTELSTTSRQLQRLLKKLEDSPQSLVFGPPPAAPGPGEAGFVPPRSAQRGEAKP